MKNAKKIFKFFIFVLFVDPLTALKWVGIVFLGGFIGYFGKYLGKLIISKIQDVVNPNTDENYKPHENERYLSKPAYKTDEDGKDYITDYKTEKKKIKVEKKRLKLLRKISENER